MKNYLYAILSLQHTKMFNFDNIINENNTEHNPQWPYIPDHPYRIIITVGFGSGKINKLLNIIKE